MNNDGFGINAIRGEECKLYLEAIFCRLKVYFTYNVSYCKDNIKCDSASNCPKCLLNNGLSIVQKLVKVKHFDNVSYTCCENIIEVFESLTTSF